jgi:ketosteroid isomerase-like protein
VEINRADVVAEVRAVFADYEKALVAGDAATVSGLFWESEHTVRFGIADAQAGAAAVRAWRYAQPPLPAGRRLADTRVTTFGTDLAVVTTGFSYPGGGPVGRQSQTWVRLPEGWRIVSAHVSHPVHVAQ